MFDYDAVLGPLGARFQGVLVGPKQTLILFADLDSSTTLALPEDEFCSESVALHLNQSRRKFQAQFRFVIKFNLT